MPKLKGFSNAEFKKEYNLVNLTDLAKLAEKGITEINREILLENGVIRNKTAPIKILGKGEISAKVSVIAEKASASALEAIAKA